MNMIRANADWIVLGLVVLSAALGLIQALAYQRFTGRKWSLRQSYYLMLATEVIWIGRAIAFVGGLILVCAIYDRVMGDGQHYPLSAIPLLTFLIVVGIVISIFARRWKRKKMT